MILGHMLTDVGSFVLIYAVFVLIYGTISYASGFGPFRILSAAG